MAWIMNSEQNFDSPNEINSMLTGILQTENR